MRWIVRFTTPTVYQPSHPKARRAVTELVVHAPDARAAELHAIRTCMGDMADLTVTPFEGLLGHPPLGEAAPDVPLTLVVSG